MPRLLLVLLALLACAIAGALAWRLYAPEPVEALLPPPAEPRPPGMKPSIKWLPESPRYLAARREHYASSRDLSTLDLGTAQVSRHQRYRLTALRPEPALNEFQAWTLQVRDAAGEPVQGAVLNVTGGMPQHGHGMPSQPRVAPGAAPGEYRVEGLQFSMPGWWEVHVYVSKDRVEDIATFNLVLR